MAIVGLRHIDMTKKKMIIGIDGGGTKTLCVLFDNSGNTLDTISGEGSNLYVYKKEGRAQGKRNGE